ARIIEGSLVGILDIGGAIQTGVGLGVPALLLGAGFVFPVANFDYYTYLGIASLFEDGKCFMFPLNGEYNSCQISASEDIIIIID
ncbi:DUF4310 family protein, partial [Salmonella enterica subsp. enterica serovar Kentucky]|nr:DUF4310 family protein [Salmonella enterica subsp. enterica serovar Kentucky]